MKKLCSLSIAILLTVCCFAQVPNNINYQAVARNNSGQALANQAIKVRLSVVRNAVTLYSETRSVTTNLLGLFNIQIGSAGATTTTGDFTTINWLTNTPNTARLKVELDINNTNTFTDMGTQPFSAVPYAMSATTAVETLNLAGRYIDPVTAPSTGDVLQWNGTAWAPYTLPAAPIVGSWQGTISPIPFGGANVPWAFAGPTVTVTVDGTQKIIANATGVLGHGSANQQPCSFSLCWSLVPAGSLVSSFQASSYTDGVIPESPNKAHVSATGVITLPAGTYKIGFGIKNKSTSVILNGNDFVNGTYMIMK